MPVVRCVEVEDGAGVVVVVAAMADGEVVWLGRPHSNGGRINNEHARSTHRARRLEHVATAVMVRLGGASLE